MGLAMGMDAKEAVLKILRNTFSKLIPGYLEVLNVISRSRYGVDAVDLLLSSPCKLYKLLKEHYGSDMVADFMMKMLLQSLISASAQSAVEEVLNYVKECNDDSVRRAIYEALQYRLEKELK